MKPSAILLSLPLLLAACDQPPELHTDTRPCSWEKEHFSGEYESGDSYRLKLNREKEWFAHAIFVLATGQGEKDTTWTIRKVSPFTATWESQQNGSIPQLREWIRLEEDVPRSTYHIAFLGEMLTGDTDGQGISERDGPISILGDTFSQKLKEQSPGKNATFRQISGVIIDSKYQGTVTRTFCGLAW